jgi:hypothetical protein
LLPVLPFPFLTGNKVKPFIFNTVTSVTRVTCQNCIAAFAFVFDFVGATSSNIRDETA